MSQNENPNETEAKEKAEHKGRAHKSGDGRRASGEVDRIREMGSDEIERLRQIGGERLENLRDMGTDLGRRIGDQVQERPFASLGVAFGVGVVASSLLTSRLGRLAILAAGGYVVKQMLGEGMLDTDDDEDEGESEERSPRGRRRTHAGH